MSNPKKIILTVAVYLLVIVVIRVTVWGELSKSRIIYQSGLMNWWTNTNKLKLLTIWSVSTIEATTTLDPTSTTMYAKTLEVRSQDNSSVSNPFDISKPPTDMDKSEKLVYLHQNETYYRDHFKRNGNRTDLMSTAPIKFLPNFKNPCWIERSQIRSASSIRDGEFTGQLRCLPYFFVAGFPKCGTTDIYDRLSMHPDIKHPCLKEPHWWSRFRNKGSPMYAYLECFSLASRRIVHGEIDYSLITGKQYNKITMDCSASTFWDQSHWKNITQNNIQSEEPEFTSADAIHRFLPDAKFVLIMRNPTDRLYSDYLFFSLANVSQEDFHERVKSSIQSIEDCFSKHSLRSCLYNYDLIVNLQVRIHIGIYVEPIKEWFKLYSRSQFLFLKTEEYSQRIAESITQILKFIDLELPDSPWLQKVEEKTKSNTRLKSRVTTGPMLAETRELLNDFYRPFNNKLIQLLEDGRFNWTLSV